MAHAYWRLLFAIHGSTGGSEVAIEELAMYDAAGASLIGGGTASASSSFSGLPASDAFDGSLSTAWNCGGSALASAAQWLQYQFASPVSVASIILTPWSATTIKSPTNFKVQYSDDGSSWTDATSSFTPTWQPSPGAPLAFPVDTPASGSYVNWRINITAVQVSGSEPVIAEFVLRTISGGSQAATGGAATASNWSSVPANAFDGNPSTAWTAGTSSLPRWLGYCFPFARDIVEVAITATSTLGVLGGSPSAATIDASNDGQNWTTIMTLSPSTWSTGQTQTFPGTPAVTQQPIMLVIT